MKRIRMFAMTLALLFVFAALTGCGKGYSSGAAADMAAPTAEAAAGEAYYDGGFYEEAVMEEAEVENGSGASSVPNQENGKWIFTGNLELYTTDFAAAQTGLETLVTSCGGYFESRETYEYDTWRDASYTVRVPSDQFEPFLKSVSGSEVLRVVHQSTTKEDVSETYYDIENRLTTLQTKLARLQELLSQAENMEDIIVIESEISDVEFQIENYTGTKNHYDSLIDYSTVYITLSEVSGVENAMEPTFGQRIAKGFSDGLENFVEGCEDFVVWLVRNLIGVIIFIAIVAVVLVLILRRRRKRSGRKPEKAPKAEKLEKPEKPASGYTDSQDK